MRKEIERLDYYSLGIILPIRKTLLYEGDRAEHRRLPFAIGADKHASYAEALTASVSEKVLPSDCKLRRVNYLNNVIEQGRGAIRRGKAGDGMLPPLSHRRADVRGS